MCDKEKVINEGEGGWVLKGRGTEGNSEMSGEEALKNNTLSAGSRVREASARTGSDRQQLE